MAAAGPSASMTEDCPVCDKAVTNRHRNALQCARCFVWLHDSCGGIPVTSQNRPILKHDNLVYLCDPCLEMTRRWFNSKNEEPKVCQASVQTDEVVREIRGVEEKVMEEKLVQTEERERKGEEEKSVQTEQAGRAQVKNAVKKKLPVCVIGDSMVKSVREHIQWTAEDTQVHSLRGAKVAEVRRKVEEKAGTFKDGLMIVQGGGNDLENVGMENTVRELIEAVQAVEGKNLSVAVVGVLKRPREGQRYERLRRQTNAKLHEEVLKLKVEWLKEKKGNVSFLDLDGVLREGMDFNVDGVHLNQLGCERMARKLRGWIYARSVKCVVA